MLSFTSDKVWLDVHVVGHVRGGEKDLNPHSSLNVSDKQQ